MFVYEISGPQPGFKEGLLFNSCVKNLQRQPELWLDECPYLQPLAARHIEGLRVRLVRVRDNAMANTQALPLAA